MLQILLITFATVALTLLLHPVLEKLGEKQTYKFHIHHSVIGVFVLGLGILMGNKIVLGIGLGFYLGHVLEEIIFCKTNIIKSFFIFVTR